MSVFNISQEDINRQKQPDNGWHLLKINNISSKAHKSKKSGKEGIETMFELEVVDTAVNKGNIGRFFYKRFYSSAAGFFIDFYRAVFSLKDDELSAGNIELEPFKGKTFWGEITEQVVQETGKTSKQMENYLPASSTPPF